MRVVSEQRDICPHGMPGQNRAAAEMAQYGGHVGRMPFQAIRAGQMTAVAAPAQVRSGECPTGGHLAGNRLPRHG